MEKMVVRVEKGPVYEISFGVGLENKRCGYFNQQVVTVFGHLFLYCSLLLLLLFLLHLLSFCKKRLSFFFWYRCYYFILLFFCVKKKLLYIYI